MQFIGGVVLHEGKIAEMKTGEGKTLVACMPVILNSIENKGVHIITVNDYLARRDALWMSPVYKTFDLKIGVLNNDKSYVLIFLALNIISSLFNPANGRIIGNSLTLEIALILDKV